MQVQDPLYGLKCNRTAGRLYNVRKSEPVLMYHAVYVLHIYDTKQTIVNCLVHPLLIFKQEGVEAGEGMRNNLTGSCNWEWGRCIMILMYCI